MPSQIACSRYLLLFDYLIFDNILVCYVVQNLSNNLEEHAEQKNWRILPAVHEWWWSETCDAVLYSIIEGNVGSCVLRHSVIRPRQEVEMFDGSRFTILWINGKHREGNVLWSYISHPGCHNMMFGMSSFVKVPPARTNLVSQALEYISVVSRESQ